MYTEQDIVQAKAKIKQDLLFGIPALIAAIALYVVGIKIGMRLLVYGAAALIFIVCCFVWCMYLWPHIRYYNFLRDMKNGLSRCMEGTFEHLGDAQEIQDGARVLPVYMFLDDEQDERILYINAGKLGALPEPGTHVKALCYGRHIRSLDF
ncbi:MAG: hypothetical protein PUD50_15100 [Eubacteriales bacterium]|nr:hypothetical protein [Eubacteriales bacterium]